MAPGQSVHCPVAAGLGHLWEKQGRAALTLPTLSPTPRLLPAGCSQIPAEGLSTGSLRDVASSGGPRAQAGPAELPGSPLAQGPCDPTLAPVPPAVPGPALPAEGSLAWARTARQREGQGRVWTVNDLLRCGRHAVRGRTVSQLPLPARLPTASPGSKLGNHVMKWVLWGVL